MTACVSTLRACESVIPSLKSPSVVPDTLPFATGHFGLVLVVDVVVVVVVEVFVVVVETAVVPVVELVTQ
jgi:hypothetical protein